LPVSLTEKNEGAQDVPYLFLTAAILANSAANVLVRLAGMQNTNGIGLFINPYFIGAAVLFGLNLGFYAFATKYIPLSTAYPVLASTSLVLVLAASGILLSEKISMTTLLGAAFIVVGIILVSWSGFSTTATQ
jgi:multidrug transporter EmrE-like cation transporter